MTSLRELGERYIWGKTVLAEKEVVSKVARLTSDLKFDMNKSGGQRGIDKKMLRMLVLKEPLLRKAIYKKNRDTVRNWFTIKPSNDVDDVPSDVLKILKNFDKKSQFQNKLYTSGVCSNIYGTGFIEKLYIEHGNNKAINKPTDSAKLVNLQVLDSEQFKDKLKPSDKKGDKTLYLEYGKDTLIHQSRIEPVSIDSLPFDYFGISVVNVAINILRSKMTADKAAGDFVDWVSKGLIDMNINGCTDEQEKKAEDTLKEHPSYLIHDEDFQVSVHSPARIDLASFYDYFYINIAAALEMPKHMLIGAEQGNVTGSEVGTSAYYNDVQNIQTLIFTPIVENIYTEVLKSYGKEWKYDICWNPIFVDELSEAKILQTRSYSATQAVASNIVSIPEARKILNEGVIKLDVDKVPEVEKPPLPTTDPNIEPQPVIKPQSKVRPLSPMDRLMIEREKQLGKKILEEQEDL